MPLVLLVLVPGIAPAQVILGPSGPVNPQKKAETRTAPSNQPQLYKLTVDPAAEPSPALKYSLTPAYMDQTPGNAVPYYYRAALQYRNAAPDQDKGFWDNYDKWMKTPPAQLPKKEVGDCLGRFETMFAQLKTAAYREQCDWDWRLRDLNGPEAIAFLLPEVQDVRGMGRLLALRARLQIAERRYDDAIRTLLLGYKLARDVAEPPTLINDLVGVAIAGVMNDQLLALIDAPGSPNMYWAAAGLPDPFINMQPALRYEMTMPARIFPFLREAESAERSPEQWRTLLVDAVKDLAELSGGIRVFGGEAPKWLPELGATALIAMGYPRAKRELIAAGYTPEQVEKLPVGQAVAIHQSRTYQYVYDEMFKWSFLPYSEGLARSEQTERKLREEGYLGRPGQSREIIPVVSLLMPAVFAAKKAEVRLASRFAGLRTLEAIRMHAAGQKGQLPKSLSDITVVPVPNDPATGSPFAYKLERGRAVLDVPDAKYPEGGWRLEITIRSAAQ
jgi:hypothetical protein